MNKLNQKVGSYSVRTGWSMVGTGEDAKIQMALELYAETIDGTDTLNKGNSIMIGMSKDGLEEKTEW